MNVLIVAFICSVTGLSVSTSEYNQTLRNIIDAIAQLKSLMKGHDWWALDVACMKLFESYHATQSFWNIPFSVSGNVRHNSKAFDD